jgi:hypothetical protein
VREDHKRAEAPPQHCAHALVPALILCIHPEICLPRPPRDDERKHDLIEHRTGKEASRGEPSRELAADKVLDVRKGSAANVNVSVYAQKKAKTDPTRVYKRRGRAEPIDEAKDGPPVSVSDAIAQNLPRKRVTSSVAMFGASVWLRWKTDFTSTVSSMTGYHLASSG